MQSAGDLLKLVGHLPDRVRDAFQLRGQLRLAATDLDTLAAGSPTASLQALDAIKAKIAGADASADWIGTGDTASGDVSQDRDSLGYKDSNLD